MLVLFDIDGTLLLRAAEAHKLALHDAIEEVWRLDLRGVAVETGGRTDLEIARDILVRGGVDARRIDDGLGDFKHAVVSHYACQVPDDLAEHLAPGAAEALETLAARPQSHVSLVTGNLEGVARLKLRAAGIGDHFAAGQGGFGSDSEDRADLPAIARRRAGAWNDGEPWPRERTVVVGDTPRDIACARADGVRVVAVPTGPFGADELLQADALIRSLHDLAPALTGL